MMLKFLIAVLFVPAMLSKCLILVIFFASYAVEFEIAVV